MASLWYLSVQFVIQVLCLYHAVSSECDIKLSKESATIGSNGNLSVLCDASCVVGDNRGDMVWYDNQFNQVSQSTGRIFSVNYGRGRYSRLVILHSIPIDDGNYICTLETNGEMKQKSFTLIHDDPTLARSKVEQDIGPRRGDVVVYDPDIIHRRPKRGAFGGSGDGDDETTTTEPEVANEPSSEPMAEPSSEPMAEPSSEPTEAETKTPLTSQPMMPTTTQKTTRQPTTIQKTTRQPTTTPKNTRQPTTTQTTSAQTTSRKGNLAPIDQGDLKPIEGRDSKTKVPNTEFGRSGLVAFVVSLSIALLLLYALVLILLIPMCLKRKKGRTSTKKRTQTTKDTPVVLSQIVKSDDNGDLPSPGPSDAGFTTIDLDEPPKHKQEDESQQASEQKQKDDVQDVPSATTDPKTTNPQESMLSSVMLASDNKPGDPAPVDDDLKFIDETAHSTESQKLDDSSVFDNSTPTVVDEPQRPTTETTEVKLEITEKEDGQKQITLSSSSPPPETESVSD